MNALQVKGLVVADTETRLRIEAPQETPLLGQVSDGMPRGVRQCLCPVCLNIKRGADMRKNAKFPEYDDIPVKKATELTAHQYLLCARAVWAYVMKARSWRKWTQANIASCSRIQDSG